MATVTVAQLESIFKKMWKEDWKYDWSGHEEGKVGCAGAFVYAFGKYGISYPNGSNRIARSYTVGGLKPVRMARPGMAAFKIRRPGEPWYKLPAAYQPGGKLCNGDLNDYYHIGLVDYDTAYVLNAQGEKNDFERNRISDWDYVARLKYVDYGEAVPLQAGEAHVIGGRLNVRSGPSKSASKLAQLPDGQIVTVESADGSWAKITWKNEGYVMSEYLSNERKGENHG